MKQGKKEGGLLAVCNLMSIPTLPSYSQRHNMINSGIPLGPKMVIVTTLLIKFPLRLLGLHLTLQSKPWCGLSMSDLSRNALTGSPTRPQRERVSGSAWTTENHYLCLHVTPTWSSPQTARVQGLREPACPRVCLRCPLSLHLELLRGPPH